MGSQRINRRGKERSAAVVHLDALSGVGLQRQIRQQLIDRIVRGDFAPGHKLPSSRELARQLGVARNTVVLACQQLVADGHLISRERSGLYVSDDAIKNPALSERVMRRAESDVSGLVWQTRINSPSLTAGEYRSPPDWQKFPYPFVEDRFDRSIFPVAEWREVNRLALGVKEAQEWSTDAGATDDPGLVREICDKVLTRRGIRAQPEQVLLTSGAQEALHILTELLVGPGSKVGIEEPGNLIMRQLLTRRTAVLSCLSVDQDGLIVPKKLVEADFVYVTPSHQRPTGATLSMDRRVQLLHKAEKEDFVIIEDDFECETNYLDDAFPALRGLSGGERVIYVAGLSRALSPGLRLGFIVADAELIQEARNLRALIARQPPLSLQRATALFFSVGHYDRTMRRLGHVFRERLIALRDGLNHYLPKTATIAPVRGGTTIWVQGPDNLDAADLARAAEARGVLIEPVSQYFAASEAPRNIFRLSVTGIPVDKIRPGMVALSDLIHEMSSGRNLWLDPERTALLSNAELRKIIPGATLLYKTVYGDPCTIELHRDGEMIGRAGYANEDQDRGRWWIEDGKWCRQWTNWAYGEPSRYRTQIKGGRISWFNEQGRLVDSAIFVPADGASTSAVN